MDANRYAPPNADLEGGFGRDVSPPLWNPNGAANWCLLFTPVFGAWLHMKNWEALGEPARARSARIWIIVSAVMIPGFAMLGAVMGSAPLMAIGRLSGFVLLIAWYFGSARGQARFVQSRFGNGYRRKAWTLPLIFAVAALIGYTMTFADYALRDVAIEHAAR